MWQTIGVKFTHAIRRTQKIVLRQCCTLGCVKFFVVSGVCSWHRSALARHCGFLLLSRFLEGKSKKTGGFFHLYGRWFLRVKSGQYASRHLTLLRMAIDIACVGRGRRRRYGVLKSGGPRYVCATTSPFSPSPFFCLRRSAVRVNASAARNAHHVTRHCSAWPSTSRALTAFGVDGTEF